MYKSVTELTREELNELKENYFIELLDAGEEAIILGDEWNEEECPLSELPDAAEFIPDEFIFEHYAGISFSADDFFCNL